MQGLEVYNENGGLEFTTVDRLSRFLDSFQIGQGAGSRYVEGLNTGTPVAITTPREAGQLVMIPPPRENLSFNTATQIVSWGTSSYPYPYTWDVTIFVY